MENNADIRRRATDAASRMRARNYEGTKMTDAAKSDFITEKTAKQDDPKIAPSINAFPQELSDEMFAAIENGDTVRVQELLEEYPGIENVRDETGKTPLIEAAEENREEAARLLLLKTADPDAQNDFGMTALMYTATNGNVAMTEMLLEANADALLMNSNDELADDVARRRGNFALAARIVQRQEMLRHQREEEQAQELAEEKRLEEDIAVLFMAKKEADIASDFAESSASRFMHRMADALHLSQFIYHEKKPGSAETQAAEKPVSRFMHKVADVLHISQFIYHDAQKTPGAAIPGEKPETPETPKTVSAPRAAVNNIMRHFRPS
ncbi:MAG: hypothetical protein GC185_04565 [Alphaproteobacteria bacterium]|nr:hypothetical protein [Alphaproteobacteria bacterium]